MAVELNVESGQPDGVTPQSSQRYRLILEYDGSRFYGWQVQPEGRTIQGTLEEVLSRFYSGPVRIHGSGRTDTGVHARGQVVHFDAPAKHEPQVLHKGLNASLPEDVRILEVTRVSEEFHARYSAHWRWYRYNLLTRERAIGRTYGWWTRHDINRNVLVSCSAALVGEHDFGSFSKADPDSDNQRCYIFAASWSFDEAEWSFHVVANRFLRHMVRRLVGGMVDAARGRFTENQFIDMLNVKGDADPVYTAPAQGLCLMQVGYAPFPMLKEGGEHAFDFPFEL
jgi:tRNA pseudouridine38-40 synthase